MSIQSRMTAWLTQKGNLAERWCSYPYNESEKGQTDSQTQKKKNNNTWVHSRASLLIALWPNLKPLFTECIPHIPLHIYSSQIIRWQSDRRIKCIWTIMDYFYGTLGFLDLQSVRLSSLLYEKKKRSMFSTTWKLNSWRVNLFQIERFEGQKDIRDWY